MILATEEKKRVLQKVTKETKVRPKRAKRRSYAKIAKGNRDVKGAKQISDAVNHAQKPLVLHRMLLLEKKRGSVILYLRPNIFSFRSR